MCRRRPIHRRRRTLGAQHGDATSACRGKRVAVRVIYFADRQRELIGAVLSRQIEVVLAFPSSAEERPAVARRLRNVGSTSICGICDGSATPVRRPTMPSPRNWPSQTSRPEPRWPMAISNGSAVRGRHHPTEAQAILTAADAHDRRWSRRHPPGQRIGGVRVSRGLAVADGQVCGELAGSFATIPAVPRPARRTRRRPGMKPGGEPRRCSLQRATTRA